MVDLRWVVAAVSGAAAVLGLTRVLGPPTLSPGTRFALEAGAFLLLVVAGLLLLHLAGLL